jgi:hypothetical protein
MYINTWYGPMQEVNGELEPSDFGVLFFTNPEGKSTVIWGTNIASSNDCHGQRFEVESDLKGKLVVKNRSTMVS